MRWGPLLFPFTGETEAQINGVTDPDLPPEMWQRRELNQPVLRLIASPQATQGVRELSRSPSQPPYLTVSSLTQKQPGPGISDSLTPQGPKRGRERDSLEVTHWGPERTESQY